MTEISIISKRKHLLFLRVVDYNCILLKRPMNKKTKGK